MKSTLILSLFVSFCMLVIPLSSLDINEKVVIQAPVTDNIKYESKANTDDNKFKILKDNVVTEFSTTDYIFGVVAAEMPALYEEEALKAQAVAAYTFALYRKANNSEADYDLTADGDTAQCFITREEAAERWGDNCEEYSKKIDACIASVQGEKLVYQNEPIFAAYHAISTGNTNNCVDVWSEDLPYLKSVESVGDQLAEGYLSEVTLSADEVNEKLNSVATASGETQNYFSNPVVNESGYVKEITYCGSVLSGNQVAKLLGLRSSSFEITFTDNIFTFTVKGYGHGVGMSQTGANYMAQQGCDYKEILLHYYPGATLEKK